jgi:hypothetical protein
MIDIQVKIIPAGGRSFREGSIDQEVAVIRNVDSTRRTCTIHLENTNESLSIPCEFLTPVPPEKKQNFKVISGHEKGKTGFLLSIDGQEGVVRFEKDANVVVMNLTSLARYMD